LGLDGGLLGISAKPNVIKQMKDLRRNSSEPVKNINGLSLITSLGCNCYPHDSLSEKRALKQKTKPTTGFAIGFPGAPQHGFASDQIWAAGSSLRTLIV